MGTYTAAEGASICREIGASLPLPKNDEEKEDFSKVGGLIDATDLDLDGVWEDSYGNEVTYFGYIPSYSKKDDATHLSGSNRSWRHLVSDSKVSVRCQIPVAPPKQVHAPPTPVESNTSCCTTI